MHVRVQSFGSGSSGNALLIELGAEALVLDCGIGTRALATGLAANGRTFSDLSALLLSHEHSDHVRSLGVIVRASVPVVCTPGTARAAGVAAQLWQEIISERPLQIGSAEVIALAVSHDAAEPCGFAINAGGTRIVVITDLGQTAGSLQAPIQAADLVVLEANHDETMLRQGPYPAYLKRRVLSRRGHLSNADCGAFLASAYARTGQPAAIWLAHLSQTNNRPELARSTVVNALAAVGCRCPVEVLPRTRRGPVWDSSGATLRPRQLTLLG